MCCLWRYPWLVAYAAHVEMMSDALSCTYLDGERVYSSNCVLRCSSVTWCVLSSTFQAELQPVFHRTGLAVYITVM